MLKTFSSQAKHMAPGSKATVAQLTQTLWPHGIIYSVGFFEAQYTQVWPSVKRKKPLENYG